MGWGWAMFSLWFCVGLVVIGEEGDGVELEGLVEGELEGLDG